MAKRVEGQILTDMSKSFNEQGCWAHKIADAGMQQLNIEPIVKQRPRVMKGGWTYTPKKTKEGEKALRELLGGYKKTSGPISLEIIFVLRRPKSPKYGYPSKGDLDNYLKFFCDAANDILWDDDRHIVSIAAEKKWGHEGRIFFRRSYYE